ncbi:hypothetical protein [Chryseobacterium sp. 2VB]|uniref:hypothetical protein n=1 Tax=Chryseobacterium sp. 2VB TaxID=2502204 RepID=UPI0010F94BA0|nr:hypothetical protein [Chryseobacterium sp. 2VB]
MKTKIPIAKYIHPKTQIKKVWIGSYGGHYEAIFFFKKKPKKTSELNDGTKYYCIVDNRDLVIGSMFMGDFKELYPDFDMNIIKPKDIEITEVIQIMFEAVYDKYGDLVSYKYNADNY